MNWERKRIRLEADYYVGKQIYFVTTCCQDRKPNLSDPDFTPNCIDILDAVAFKLRFAVHAYCFMPDHAHLLVEGLADECALPDFVSCFKQLTAYEFRKWHANRLWQFKYYDHVLRRTDHMNAVASYIWMNPVRKGLTRDPLDYPLSGSFTMLWKSNLRPSDAWKPPWKSEPTVRV